MFFGRKLCSNPFDLCSYLRYMWLLKPHFTIYYFDPTVLVIWLLNPCMFESIHYFLLEIWAYLYLFVPFCWQLFASFPWANVKILFYSVSLPFWWWLLWRNLQALDALFFSLLIRAALKYLAYLIGYVFFQMETPYFLGKHWLAYR